MKAVAIHSVADPVVVKTGRRLLDALDSGGIPIIKACGGKGLCATCHVHVRAGADALSPITPREQMSLGMVYGAGPASRLACQAKVRGPGLAVALPSGKYIEHGTKDLEALVGRRAESRILHPVNGSVLVEAGKIITRGRIRQLAQVDVDIEEMQTRSLTIR